jgi:hypothetical protein
MSSSSHPAMSHQQTNPLSSAGRSSRKGKLVAEPTDFTSPTSLMKYFEPCAATASMYLYGRTSIVPVAPIRQFGILIWAQRDPRSLSHTMTV